MSKDRVEKRDELEMSADAEIAGHPANVSDGQCIMTSFLRS